jgi:hypothetical protein
LLVVEQSPDEISLAERLLEEWDGGRGASKSEIERRTWDDGSSHGRRFDRFIQQTLGVSTSRRSKQTSRIGALERQLRGLGRLPVGATPEPWEQQLQHARDSCLAALRTWNDPTAPFRTGAFSLLFVTAWNSVAIAIIQRSGGEWRQLDQNGDILIVDGVERSRDTVELIADALPEDIDYGARENIRFWIDLRNCVAHRHLPALDLMVIPYAQAGLVNIESKFDEFGDEFTLAEALSVPLQLSGFRDPSVLSSVRTLQASLPVDVQALLGRAEASMPELLSDPTFMLRVAFIPAVPSSGRSPDAVAYFVKPGQVPDELASMLEHYVVLPKVSVGGRPNLPAMHVVEEVRRRTGLRFHSGLHAEAARRLGARPPRGEGDDTVDLRFAEYITSFKRYLYTQVWIDHLVEQFSVPDGFMNATGSAPQAL